MVNAANATTTRTRIDLAVIPLSSSGEKGQGMQVGNMHHIKTVSISKLYGRYSYLLPKEKGDVLDDISIVYGQNGAGKTTFLNLIFHLLSPSRTSGHRGAISEIPFKKLEITLNDGTVISAEKDEQLLVGDVLFKIKASGSQVIEWTFEPSRRSTISVENLPAELVIAKLPKHIRDDVVYVLNQKKFSEQLAQLQVTTYMLTSDRILHGDTVERIDSPEIRDSLRAKGRLSEAVVAYRVKALEDAVATASRWLMHKYYESNLGARESAANIYLDLVKKIAKAKYKTNAGLKRSQETEIHDKLTTLIEQLIARGGEYAKFGLAGPSISPDIIPVLVSCRGNKLELITSVLQPYLESLRARLDNIEPLYSLIESFVSNANSFFTDKVLTYSVGVGLRISTTSPEGKQQELSCAALSSGEKQLLLLLCNVLAARDKPSVFIIDEPELSLNIVWQRKLLTSLRLVASGASVQFLFASHSMEIISKHRNHVIAI